MLTRPVYFDKSVQHLKYLTRQHSTSDLPNIIKAWHAYQRASKYSWQVYQQTGQVLKASTDQLDQDEAQTKQFSLDQVVDNKNIGLGFSAGGLLFPYYIGIVDQLEQQNIIDRSTPLAGASAGSLISSLFNSGMSIDDLTYATRSLCHDVRQKGTRLRLRSVLEGYLNEMLPENAHVDCSGVSTVAVTLFEPLPKAVLINEFESRDDMIQCLLASCHIPGYVDKDIFTRCRGTLAADGGLTAFLPTPQNVTDPVRVSCFPIGKVPEQLGLPIITPDLFQGYPIDTEFNKVIVYAFLPPPEEYVESLIDKGRHDAEKWVIECRKAQEEGVASKAAGEEEDKSTLVDTQTSEK